MRRKSVLEANKQLQLETRGVTVRDSAFNFNTGSSFTRGSGVVGLSTGVHQDNSVAESDYSCPDYLRAKTLIAEAERKARQEEQKPICRFMRLMSETE